MLCEGTDLQFNKPSLNDNEIDDSEDDFEVTAVAGEHGDHSDSESDDFYWHKFCTTGHPSWTKATKLIL